MVLKQEVKCLDREEKEETLGNRDQLSMRDSELKGAAGYYCVKESNAMVTQHSGETRRRTGE